MTQPSDAVDNSVPELPLEDRVENRSHRPSSDAFKKFMGSNWQQPQQIDYQPDASASYAAQRRLALSRQFPTDRDRKSTRLNSSHVAISYAVFCLKKKNSKQQ